MGLLARSKYVLRTVNPARQCFFPIKDATKHATFALVLLLVPNQILQIASIVVAAEPVSHNAVLKNATKLNAIVIVHTVDANAS